MIILERTLSKKMKELAQNLRQATQTWCEQHRIFCRNLQWVDVNPDIPQTYHLKGTTRVTCPKFKDFIQKPEEHFTSIHTIKPSNDFFGNKPESIKTKPDKYKDAQAVLLLGQKRNSQPFQTQVFLLSLVMSFNMCLKNVRTSRLEVYHATLDVRASSTKMFSSRRGLSSLLLNFQDQQGPSSRASKLG